MEFGWINVFGAAIVILMLIPNIIYALKHRDEKNLCDNRFMIILEQVGRYACIILMWLPLLTWKFGFTGIAGMILYLAGNAVMLAVYWIIFAGYMKEKHLRSALFLAILPTCIFLLSGLVLRHWLLVAFAIIFGIGHIYVTRKNAV